MRFYAAFMVGGVEGDRLRRVAGRMGEEAGKRRGEEEKREGERRERKDGTGRVEVGRMPIRVSGVGEVGSGLAAFGRSEPREDGPKIIEIE